MYMFCNNILKTILIAKGIINISVSDKKRRIERNTYCFIHNKKNGMSIQVFLNLATVHI